MKGCAQPIESEFFFCWILALRGQGFVVVTMIKAFVLPCLPMGFGLDLDEKALSTRQSFTAS